MLSVVSAFAADVAGTWALTVDTPNGPLEVTLVLKQDGDKVAGKVNSQMGETTIAGTVKDNEIKMSMTMDGVGDIIYAAKVSADGKMEGTLDVGGQGAIKFTGVKK